MLRRCFSEFGAVTEVFLPSKRNKVGDRFGFVRFEEVKHINKLLSHPSRKKFGYPLKAFQSMLGLRKSSLGLEVDTCLVPNGVGRSVVPSGVGLSLIPIGLPDRSVAT
ncbi:hypothetical protein KIW84_031114 [Lathyrus oleraceus]|uniref:RRM domain-containing protein n=1 Tax=Pisum sativum TaxID=3888 RepID=A0A9D5AX26_PEA|nr:hypothetical protein KIW84_031114 [Pisum sativum]